MNDLGLSLISALFDASNLPDRSKAVPLKIDACDKGVATMSKRIRIGSIKREQIKVRKKGHRPGAIHRDKSKYHRPSGGKNKEHE